MSRFLLASSLAFLFACGSSGGGGGGGDDDAPSPDAPAASCANLAGNWAISGSCGADGCAITQVGCAITQVNCVSGAHSTSGTIDGNAFSYTGESGGGTPSTCSGTASGNRITGTCTVGGLGTCDFTGDRQ